MSEMPSVGGMRPRAGEFADPGAGQLARLPPGLGTGRQGYRQHLGAGLRVRERGLRNQIPAPDGGVAPHPCPASSGRPWVCVGDGACFALCAWCCWGS